MSDGQQNANQEQKIKAPLFFKAMFLLIITLAILVAGALIIVYKFNFPGNFSSSHSIWGQAGDFFGGLLNPVFGFLSLIAILLTLYYQVQELQASTLELKQSATALKSQHEIMQRQAFENNLFQMLKLFEAIVAKSGSVNDPGVTRFHTLKNNLKDRMTNLFREKWGKSDIGSIDLYAFREIYDIWYKSFAADLGHYFRYLYRIYRYIDESIYLSDQEKIFYSKIVRAQISDPELVMLYYNCISNKGVENFLPLAEKYSLFDNLEPIRLIKSEHYDLVKDISK